MKPVEEAEKEEKEEKKEVSKFSDKKARSETLTKKKISEMQLKLLRKILPTLESHMFDTNDKLAVRSFVTVCYAKIIRKLPTRNFTQSLHKMVNLIVTQGLRSKNLSHREKARKALVRLIEEVSPMFLSLIFEEMKTQLTKGF